MADSRPFLGETHDRDQAFFGIEALDLTVEQDKFGHYTQDGRPRENRFTKHDIPGIFPARIRAVSKAGSTFSSTC